MAKTCGESSRQAVRSYMVLRKVVKADERFCGGHSLRQDYRGPSFTNEVSQLGERRAAPHPPHLPPYIGRGRRPVPHYRPT